jgi:uncharacterized protein YbjT (DUF2867 family)
MIMQNVLLAGATGNLGPHLAKELVAHDKNVFALIHPKSMLIPEKVDPLKSLGVNLVMGDVNNPISLDAACIGMDAVISALGGGQILQQEALLKSAKAARVKRFIPSEFGVDPFAAGPGRCDLFDAKAAVQQMVKDSGIDYTMIYANGFMEFWAGGLGQLGNVATTGEVSVFGNGRVKASMMSLSDIARFTVEILDDPAMANRDVRLTANVQTQEELIETWEKLSDSKVKRNPVSEDNLLQTISQCVRPEDMMNKIFTQLHHSVWIHGDTMKERYDVLEATRAYPNIPVTSSEAFLSSMLPVLH